MANVYNSSQKMNRFVLRVMVIDLLPNIVAQSDTPVATYRQLLALPPFVRQHASSVRRSLVVFVSTDTESRYWYLNNKLHREDDLPAMIWENGVLRWYVHGKLHRDGDLPAIVWAGGDQEWWQHGKRHRDGDLPAKIYKDGTQEWWLHGVKVTNLGSFAAIVG